MSASYTALIEDEIEIAAPPAQVWDLISDVCRMPEWSPQVKSTRLRSGFDRVELGTEFTNLNVHGELEWKTRAQIVRFTPGEELAFRIEENWVVWAFRVEPTDRGDTRLIQRRETPEGISEVSLNLTESAMGGQEAFTQLLRNGMRQTLESIKTTTEG